MAKNRNKKKRNDAVSMDISEPSAGEIPQAMETSEPGAQGSGAPSMKIKKGRPLKRSKNVRKMKAIEKAISASEKTAQKISKNQSKKLRVQSAKVLYD
ncbi:uncharacterized protein LOC129300537 [Prosopis cineraria]|uniref:uncharacterized protein LOC129300537 n=1 Tax=Prosopis cineraria TaxID=364024 RepID=UPI0024102F82|nr:uncharacterized protein LOC129300537 [Prosopis cineraria]